ncbi:condensation domain-containing protein, partial [Brevibacterium aurantiacum]
LRSFAADRLPEYMVPTVFIRIDSFPTTPNGKLDRRALPAPDLSGLSTGGRAPETDTEQTLATIFRDVLNLDADTALSVDDDFFRLGGDSILSIQVVARAKRSGVTVTAAEVFTTRTIAGLATLADARAGQEREDTALDDVSSVGLWPIAAQTINNPGFGSFAQSFAYTTPPELTSDVLHTVLTRIVDHHPALRGILSSDQNTSTGWRFDIQDIDRVDVTTRIVHTHLDISWSSPQWQEQIKKSTKELTEHLAPEAGLIWRATWYTSDEEADGRLLIVIHHLVVDGVSWRILADDLKQAWELETGATGDALLPVGTSLTTWAHALTTRAADSDVTDQLNYWQQVSATNEPLLGTRALDPSRDTGATARHINVTVPADVTRTVLGTVPHLLSAEVNDVLLGALTIAVGAWRAQRGVDHRGLVVGLEGHGREETFVPGSDLSRTVGWFTTWYPVALDTDEIEPAVAAVDPDSAAEAVLRVKDRLAGVPDRGIGYGLLRHLNPVGREALADAIPPQVGFNYLGQFTTGNGDKTNVWGTAPEAPGLGGHGSPVQPLPAVIDINAATVNDSTGPVVEAGFAYAAGILAEADVRELADLWAQALGALAEYATNTTTVRRSISDFTAKNRDREELTLWEDRYGPLDDVQPLTPLQQGLVFHTELDADGVDVYVTQTILRFAGGVDPDRMHDALTSVVERFPNLKAAIVTDNSAVHVSVIPTTVTVPFNVVDADGRGSIDVIVRDIADSDRAEPFDLARPPLLRGSLVHDGNGKAMLVLTMHHVLADGWSTPALVGALLDAYRNPGAATTTDTAYPRFLEWLDDRDDEASLGRWRSVLAPVEEPTLIAPETGTLTGFPDETRFTLDAGVTTRLGETAQSTGATLSTLVQAAWGVFLNTLTGQETVVFGTTVSGRPAEIDGIEDTVGLFINTIPTPITLAPDVTLEQLLSGLQEQNTGLLEDHHVSLPELHRLTGLSPLFDTLVVYENYPIDEESLALGITGLDVSGIEGRDSTHYPITLEVIPGRELAFQLSFAVEVFDRATVDRFATVFTRILHAFAGNPTVRVADLDVLPTHELDQVRGWATGDGLVIPAGVTLDSLLRDQAAATPDAVAVVSDDGQELTYHQFDTRINRFARLLGQHGVAVGDRIGVLLPRSTD